MMRFAAYYGFTIDCNCNIAAYNLVTVGRNLPETCSGLNLARWLGTARGRQDHFFFDLKSNQSLDLFLMILDLRSIF
jgi:hypothetical protein